MTTSINSINVTLATILNDSNTNKLKDSKAELEANKAIILGYKCEYTQGATESALKARTKSAFQHDLCNVIKGLSVLTADNKEAKEMIEKEERLEDLDMLATTIRLELANAQKSFLTVGRCLVEANESIKANGGNQKEFLDWANDHCEIKKAQAYKLMKVYKDFGDSSDFNGVAMRVLYALTGATTEQVESARELAKEGKLDTQALDGIMMKEAPKKETAPADGLPLNGKPTVKGETVLDRDHNHEDNTQAMTNDQLADKEISDAMDNMTPAEIKMMVGLEDTESNESTTDSTTDSSDSTTDSTTDNTVEALNDTIKELNKTVADLQAQLAQAQAHNVKASMPALPQFDSPCMATVIGLEADNAGDKIKINKAYRALASIYTKDSSPESAHKLLTARTALLSAIK